MRWFKLSLIPFVLVGALIALRLLGVLRPFSVPTGSMTPAVSPGDRVIMEGMTFLARKPSYGDIVVYKSEGARLPAGALYIKRVAGVPGDHVRISNGKLFVNDKHLALSNAVGEIVYSLPEQADPLLAKTGVAVSNGCYFLLGDYSINSLDSRYFGSVPRDCIIGRIFFCYWPSNRVGPVK